LQEGQNWEAIMYASAKKVDNLIATIDLNGKQIDGSTDEVLAWKYRAKFEAFDWDIDIKEGTTLKLITWMTTQSPNRKASLCFTTYRNG
jgi:transketolase